MGYNEKLATTTDIKNNGTLKLIKTITLEEPVASIETTFEKPLKDIYVRFIGKLDIEAEVNDCTLVASCNNGSQYFVWASSCSFSPTTNKGFIFHAKEVTPLYWETDFGSTINVTDAGKMQGISAHTCTIKKSYSARNANSSQLRYVNDLKFAINKSTYSFAVGSTLEIYGLEGEE